MENLNPPAIVGEAVAGQAGKALKAVKSLISHLTVSTFDLMDALYDIKTNKWYSPKHVTFAAYIQSLDIKPAKAYYLVRIKHNMIAADIPREKYEPVGVSKLRVIASIDPYDHDNKLKDGAVKMLKDFVDTGVTATLEELKTGVDVYNGNVGDEAFDFLNIKLKKSAKAVIKNALELAKMQIGSVSTDADGMSHDASDGAAMEMICMDYLADVNNAPDIEIKGDGNEAV